MIHWFGMRSRTCGRIAVAAILLGLGGCTVVGAISGTVGHALPNYVAPAYSGLAGQRVAVMIWVEQGVRADFPYLALDVAAGIQERLKSLQQSDKPKELEKTTFPIRPDTIIRYQEDHPELEDAPLVQTAARLNVDRLIYLEIDSFSTRSEASIDLYRGSIDAAQLQVLEIGNGTAKSVFRENNIKVVYPKKDPTEGEPEGNDAKVYKNTLDAFTTQIAERFYTHDTNNDEE
jgi:hypothetical protein